MTKLSKRSIKVIFITVLLNAIVCYGSECESLAKINLYNSTNWSGPTTVEPWRPGVGHSLVFSKEAEALGLALKWDYEGKTMAPGDRRVVWVEGQVPTEAGETTLTVTFTNSFRPPKSFIEQKLTLSWGL